MRCSLYGLMDLIVHIESHTRFNFTGGKEMTDGCSDLGVRVW